VRAAWKLFKETGVLLEGTMGLELKTIVQAAKASKSGNR